MNTERGRNETFFNDGRKFHAACILVPVTIVMECKRTHLNPNCYIFYSKLLDILEHS